MSRFFSERYKDLEAYTPGEQPKVKNLIKLNTNECPYPPSPKVIEAVTSAEVENQRLYSDPESAALVKAIADFYGVEQNMVAVGNGSDEILAFSFMAFQNKEGKIYAPEISYGFYPVYGDVFGANFKGIPLKENLEINPLDYAGLDGTIIIANPNAPTGIALTLEQIEGILKTNKDNLVIIDEAYVDFGAETCVPLLKKYDNLMVVQTFSKSRSLAGARIGFAISSAEIIEDINKIKFSFNPYNLGRLEIISGAASISDKEYFDETRAKVIATRESFVKEMEALGFDTLKSSANFIFTCHEKMEGEYYFSELRKRNIIVRHFKKEKIKNYVRITIGLPEEMEKLLEATKEILKNT